MAPVCHPGQGITASVMTSQSSKIMREPLAQGADCTLAGSDASAVLRHTVQPAHQMAETIILGQGVYACFCFKPVAALEF